MQYIDMINPCPIEPDYSYICNDYVVISDEYQDSYNFIPLLKHLSYYDGSSSPQEWYTYKENHLQAHWIVFVTCRPQDMDRLRHVAKRMKLFIEVKEDEPDEMLLPFV